MQAQCLYRMESECEGNDDYVITFCAVSPQGCSWRRGWAVSLSAGSLKKYIPNSCELLSLFSLSPSLFVNSFLNPISLSLYPSRPSLKGDTSKTTVRIKQGPDCLQCQDYTAGMYRLMVKICDVTVNKNVRNYIFYMHTCIPSIICIHTHTHTHLYTDSYIY